MKKTIYKSFMRWSTLFLLVATAFAGPKTYTGTLGDQMCGLKHVVAGSAQCTQMCVQHGSKYALLIKEKVYTLKIEDKTLLPQFNDLSGKTVSIKGTAVGDTIEVISIKQK